MRKPFSSLCAPSPQEASCLRAIHTGKIAQPRHKKRKLPGAPLTPLKGRIPDKPSETENPGPISSFVSRGGRSSQEKKEKNPVTGEPFGLSFVPRGGTKNTGACTQWCRPRIFCVTRLRSPGPGRGAFLRPRATCYLPARARISGGVRTMSYNLTSSIAPLNGLPPLALSQPICSEASQSGPNDHAPAPVWVPLT